MYSNDPPEMFAKKYCHKRMSSWGLRNIRRVMAAPPVLAMFRPQVGQCCHQCTPKSLDVKLLQRSPSLGFQNLLHISEKNTRYRGWLVRRLCCVLFVGSRTVYSNTPGDRVERLFKSNGGKKVLSSTDPMSDEENQQGLTFNTKELNTYISPLLLRITSWVLLKLLRGLFYSVQVNLNQVAALHKVTALGHPLVFVSQQQRGLDYILIALMLFCHNLQVPYTVYHLRPGSTLIRLVLQHLGVVFPPPQAEQDVDESGLHGASMTYFIGKLLQEGRSVSFGLAVSSGQGACWLARIREAVRGGAVPDVSVVPVSVAYDRTAQLHIQAQGVISLLCSLLSLFCEGVRGSVRIHFAHPFSLKEMCDAGKYHVAGARPLKEVLLPVILDNRLDNLFRQKTMSWILHPSFCPDLPPSERELTIYLTQHLLYSTAACTAMMSTGLVSCLLLHKHPKGLHLSQLYQDFYWLLKEVLLRKRDVGFGGSLPVVLYHTLSILRPHLILVSLSDVTNLFLAPRSSPTDVLALAAHCQPITHVFIKEAVGACAVSAMLREVASCGRNREVEFGVAFCQETLTETALKLSHLLPAGYIPPCTSAHSFAVDAVDSLVHCGILVKEEQLQDHCVYDFWRRQKDLLWRSSDDMDYSDSDCEEQEVCCYKLSQPSQCTDLLFFLCSLLSVYLRALSWAIEWLDLLHSPLPESDSQAALHSFLQDRVMRDQRHHESSSADMAEVAVRTFIDLGVLEKVESGDGGVPVLGLSSLFQQHESRQKLGCFIQQFLHT